ncbi:MAG: imidazole glycerol phosphate synthase subunit HisH [Candidatus Omnitrophota bacterium]
MATRQIGIIDYGMGNIKSVYNALHYFGEDAKIVFSEKDFKDCSHLILPGVGAFPQAMRNLSERDMIRPIKAHVDAGKPFLGICLGMQLLADKGEEMEVVPGLGIVPGHVRRLDVKLHIPHVGWNNLIVKKEHPVFEGMKSGVDFYFVHSYYFHCADSSNLLATAEYEKEFSCAITNGRSAVAVQFHPEKSQANGLKILENFCNWDGQSSC